MNTLQEFWFRLGYIQAKLESIEKNLERIRREPLVKLGEQEQEQRTEQVKEEQEQE